MDRQVPGVRLSRGYFFHREHVNIEEEYFWRKGPSGNDKNFARFRRLSDSEFTQCCSILEQQTKFRAPFVEGYWCEVPLVEMGQYLPVLAQRVRSNPLFLEWRTVKVTNLVDSVREAGTGIGLVVNCTGLGAKTLVQDEAVWALRGQLLRFPPLEIPLPEQPQFVLDIEGTSPSLAPSSSSSSSNASVSTSKTKVSAYIFNRPDSTIVGGCAIPNYEQTEVDQVIMQQIRTLNEQYFLPGLSHQPSRAELVGLRPCRTQVRLEVEWLQASTVTKRQVPLIHNYGHGGSGLTLCWGCADEVAQLASQFSFKDSASHLRSRM
jgi:D-amino-acid oxidase